MKVKIKMNVKLKTAILGPFDNGRNLEELLVRSVWGR